MNDIVVEDFQDTYYNLTLKTIFLLKWVSSSSHCSSPKESIINIFNTKITTLTTFY